MNRLVKNVLLIVLTLAIALPVGVILAQGDETPIAQGVVIQEDGTGIYAEPNINAEIVGRLEGGETIYIYEERGLFARTDEGWVLASALDIGPAQVDLQGIADTSSDLAIRSSQDIESAVVTTVPSGSVVGVLLIDGLWAQVYTGDNIGWTFVRTLELGEPTSDLVDFSQAAATVATDSAAAVREEPNLGAEVIGTVEDGAEGRVLAGSDDGLFVLARFDDVVGWVFLGNLDVQSRATARGTFSVGPVNFRDAPSDDATLLQYLPFQGQLLILGRSEDGEWLKIRYNAPIFISGAEVLGAEGWVSATTVDTETDIESLPVVE